MRKRIWSYDRLLEYARLDSSGCWIWQGSKGHGGYGRVVIDGRPRGVHRLAWELANGCQVPPKLWVLHRCDNRLCVHLDHIFLGTALFNNRDMFAKGRARAGGRTCRPAPHMGARDFLAKEAARG